MRKARPIGDCLVWYFHRSWPGYVMVLMAGLIAAASGCAVLAGGAAGAATGYVAGHEAADGD